MFAAMRSACLAAVVLAHAMAFAVAARSLHQTASLAPASTPEELTSTISAGTTYIFITDHLDLTSYVSGAVPVGIAPTMGTTLGSVTGVALLAGSGCVGTDGEDFPCILSVSKPLMQVGHSMVMSNLVLSLVFYATSFESSELLSVSGTSGKLYMFGVILFDGLETPMNSVGVRTSGMGSVYAEGCAFYYFGCWSGSTGCVPAFDVGGGSASLLDSSFYYCTGSQSSGIIDITYAGAQGLRLEQEYMNVSIPSGYYVHESVEGSASLVYSDWLNATYDVFPPTGVLTPNPLSSDASEGGIFLTGSDQFLVDLVTTLQGGAAQARTPAGIQSVIGFEHAANMTGAVETVAALNGVVPKFPKLSKMKSLA